VAKLTDLPDPADCERPGALAYPPGVAPAADPITRARAREGAGLHRLRKGRDECGAQRRDGQPCQAPAIEGGLVCLRHGGSAPQVRIAARLRVLQLALYVATLEWEEARGTWRADDAMGRCSIAERELREYEFKLARLANLRAEVRKLDAAAPARTTGPVTP
jgi:hypothetical protein